MKVTIAVPTYNRTKYLDDVFASAMHQSFNDYEVLIADSSDNDSVLEKIKPYFSDAKTRYLRFPPKTAALAKFNALVKEACGEWVVFLCDDDLLDTDYLSALMEHVKSQPRATLARCRFKVIDDKGSVLRMDPISKAVMGPAEFLSHLFLPDRKFFKMNVSGILFHRETFLKEGGFREFPLGWYADLLAWATLGSRGISLFEKRALASIRVHSDAQSSSYTENFKADIQTNLGVSEAIQNLLKRLDHEVTTSEDRNFLRIARKNSRIYMRRHLSRVFDHAFVAALSSNRSGIKESLKSLFETMKKMKVPVFRSVCIYLLLGNLNYFIRRPLLDMVKLCKTKKWCN